MAQRNVHYEQAFEQYLRSRAVPYIAVDEAKRALMPAGECRQRTTGGSSKEASKGTSFAREISSLKSFDFVVYSGQGDNFLVDIKGRKQGGRSGGSLDNWVTREDLDSLARWQQLFGAGFRGLFVFLYWCERQPPDALFLDLFQQGERWYALMAVTLEDYLAHHRVRSPRWETVCLDAASFRRVARPFAEHLGLIPSPSSIGV